MLLPSPRVPDTAFVNLSHCRGAPHLLSSYIRNCCYLLFILTFQHIIILSHLKYVGVLGIMVIIRMVRSQWHRCIVLIVHWCNCGILVHWWLWWWDDVVMGLQWHRRFSGAYIGSLADSPDNRHSLSKNCHLRWWWKLGPRLICNTHTFNHESFDMNLEVNKKRIQIICNILQLTVVSSKL